MERLRQLYLNFCIPSTFRGRNPQYPSISLLLPSWNFIYSVTRSVCSIVPVSKLSDKGFVTMLDDGQKIVPADDARPRPTLLVVCVLVKGKPSARWLSIISQSCRLPGRERGSDGRFVCHGLTSSLSVPQQL